MLKYCKEKWDKNRHLLERAIRNDDYILNKDYKQLFALTVKCILNDGDDIDETWNTKAITEIDNSDYQGTLLFTVPKIRYQPNNYDYLITYVWYGSCSGCDTLERIRCGKEHHYDEDTCNTIYEKQSLNNEDVRKYMQLCKDMICNIIKPYNRKDTIGYDEEFEHVEIDGDYDG